MLRFMRKMKILGAIAALLALVTVLGAPAAVYAATSEIPDETMTGTVAITLKDMDSGEAVPGGTITAKKVCTVTVVDGGNFYFTPVDELKDCDINFDDVTRTDLASELSAYLAENTVELTTQEAVVGKDGYIAFSDLSIGLWLFENKKPADGYEIFTPFVVSVPTYDEDSRLYNYDIDATPKVAVKKAVTPPPPSITVTPSIATPTPSTATPTPKPTLPQTGQLWWPVPVLAIAGAAFILFGWLRRRSR